MRKRSTGLQAGWLSTVGAVTALIHGPAFAQETVALEEVVVTAQKRAESVQDIPVSIAALSGDALESAGVDAQVALAALTPGVAVNQNANFTAVYIRGVGTQYANPGLEPSVGTYFDDVYSSRASSGFISFADVERVEVLKGPQGILYGRNTTGGIIRVVTKDPTDEFEAGVGLQAGNYDAFQADGYLSGPFTDSVQGRFAFQYEKNDGWVKNITPGAPRLQQRDAYLVRGKLNWDVNDNLSVKLMADWSEREGLEGLAFLPLFDGPPEQAIVAFGGQIDPKGKKYSGNTPYKDEPHAFHLRVGGAELRVDYEGSGYTFSSITGYRYNRFNGLADLDGTTLPFYNANTRRELSIDWSQEFQLVSDNSGPLQYVAGLFYWHEVATDDFGASGLAVDGGLSPIIGAPPPGSTWFSGGDGRVEIESYAPYGQVTYAITPQWELLAGARYTVEEKKLKYNHWYVATVDLATTHVNSRNLISFGEAPPDKFKEKEFTPKIGVNWRPIDDVMLYASFSKGFKSGGFNLPDPAPPVVDKVESEKVDAYEVGWKAQFGRFRINGAYFHYKAEDLQIQVTDPSGGITSIRNAASSKTDGVELDLTAAITPELQIGVGVGWLDAKFDKFPDGQAFVPCSIAAAQGWVDVAGTCDALGGLGLATVVQDQSGNELPQAPEWTGNIRVDYRLQLPGDAGTLAFNAVESYTSKFSWTADNLYKEPSKWLLNASVRWTSADGRFGASVYGINLTDKEYNTHQSPFPGTGGWRVPGTPRLYGARVTYSF
jgi:iron complex outermembrane receptor protein